MPIGNLVFPVGFFCIFIACTTRFFSLWQIAFSYVDKCILQLLMPIPAEGFDWHEVVRWRICPIGGLIHSFCIEISSYFELLYAYAAVSPN
jgi:hypothetical protein